MSTHQSNTAIAITGQHTPSRLYGYRISSGDAHFHTNRSNKQPTNSEQQTRSTKPYSRKPLNDHYGAISFITDTTSSPTRRVRRRYKSLSGTPTKEPCSQTYYHSSRPSFLSTVSSMSSSCCDICYYHTYVLTKCRPWGTTHNWRWSGQRMST